MSARRIAMALLATALLELFTLANTTSAADPAVPTDWRSTELLHHPLVGAIWSARDGRTASASELALAISSAPYALLGEVHDNPDHHRLQGWEIAKHRELSAVMLEMLSRDHSDQLTAFYSDKTAGARAPERFAQLVEWDKSGWPSFEIYAPIISAALGARATVGSASPPRSWVTAVSKNGLSALGAVMMKWFDERLPGVPTNGPLSVFPELATRLLGLDAPLDPALASELKTEIKDAHCGLFPDEALPRMAEVQRLRDAFMADAIGTDRDGKRVVLIAGNGHVRRDRGVPYYLKRRGVKPDEIVSVMHVEVEDGQTDPATYVPRAPDGTPAVDYLWFTPRQARDDPCEKMREHLEKQVK